ncbi:DUF4190 domain-containing protein [Gordonia paraffinivorans]|uniref:DUF4190 domain-containing protein n=1 Tax=Gordonia paraffinivorans TaxID=175628 RepID=UPI00215AC74C|nr:DUF4190 domain-containing protein [Gordonia paraffinivorans]
MDPKNLPPQGNPTRPGNPLSGPPPAGPAHPGPSQSGPPRPGRPVGPPPGAPASRSAAAAPRHDAPPARPAPPSSRPEPDSPDEATRLVAADNTVLVDKRPPPHHDESPGPEGRSAPAPATQAYSETDPTPQDEPEDNVGSQTRGVPRLNRTAVWALICSGLGITFLLGLFLGYRARAQIRRTREIGKPYADVAIWLGWFYLSVIVFGLLVYVWILFIA